MKWKFDKCSENRFVVDGVESHAAVLVLDGDGVGNVSVGETQRGDEAQVEIFAEAFAADDAYGEAGHDVGFDVIDADGLRGFATDRSHGPSAWRELKVLVVVNGLDGVHHLVESQQKTEVVRLLLVFRQVVHHFSLGHDWGHETCRNQQCDGDYLGVFLHFRSIFNVRVTICFRFYCMKNACKNRKFYWIVI